VEVPNFSDLQDLEAMWALWDDDGSGELDKDEFKMALKMLQVRAPFEREGNPLDPQTQWRAVDHAWRTRIVSNRSVCETHPSTRFMQVEDVDDIDRIYNDIDDDGNGTISMDEFAAWWFNDQSSGTAAKTVRKPSQLSPLSR
jgi:hypothetical protein